MPISVIIPVYNHALALARCFDSLSKQTLKPDEVIVVDDGSTDNFPKVMEEIRLTPSYESLNTKVVHQKNMGAAAARNRGFSESRGEFIVFFDADTLAEPRMLEQMMTALIKNPTASYAYSQYKFGWKKMKSHAFDAELLKKNNYIDTTSLVRRSALPEKPFDESLKRFQDWDLWLTLLERGKAGVFLSEVLYKKIVHGRSGISYWLPKFIYRLPWCCKAVRDFENAKKIVQKKHQLITQHEATLDKEI